MAKKLFICNQKPEPKKLTPQEVKELEDKKKKQVKSNQLIKK